MNDYDEKILNKIIGYCDEISKTHEYFKSDKEMFYNKENGFAKTNC